jgi:hypothetical protein
MIIIVIVRRAFCEICHESFDLEFGEDPPANCKLCGSKDWELAPEIRDATYIRKGITKKKRRLNPGAASIARQGRGKAQWRQFRDREGNPV